MNFTKLEIDKNSPLPYYYQLEWLIRDAIDNGELNKHSLLPSVGELADQLKVSVSVVRQAFKRLEENGFLLIHKGRKARIISEKKIQLTYINSQTSLYTELLERGLKVRTKVLKKSISPASDDISKKLEIETGQRVFEISRLRLVEGKPMIFWISFLPYSICPGIENFDFKKTSLYKILLESFNLCPHYADRYLEVMKANKYEREILCIPVGEPIVCIESSTRLKNNTIMEYYKAWHTANNWKFYIHCEHEIQ
jgi:GntR family transcriptional regulator